MFHPDNRSKSDRHNATYAAFEIAHTVVDFLAALCFVLGSAMFFSDAWETAALWMFLIGSLLFACKPTLRLIRELRLAKLGDWDDITDKHDS